MKKPERDWFIRATGNFEMELTDKRRALLAEKGKRLYQKYCGLNGEGICAESFAEYHALRGEHEVVNDFLDFLHIMITVETDSTKIKITEELVERIENLLKLDN
ncbi:MAG: hypothetical protein Phog2KO_39160 [Phototrophicaceae bacterium]